MTNKEILAAAALLLTVSCQSSAVALRGGSAGDPQLVRGETLYRNVCLSCHGGAGSGQGPVAAFLRTKPRDFRTAVYKFRSTPTGTMPTRQDLVATITGGVHGTSMPPFADLVREDADALASYVEELSRVGARGQLEQAVAAGELEAAELESALEEQMKPGTPIEIPQEPPTSGTTIARGRVLYERMDCAKCHGPSGRGDGPSSDELVDNWGHPIVPADFTMPGGIKGGSTGRDIYRTFMTGMDGTPMPSYAGQLEPAQAWDLTHFVLWLRRDRTAAIR